MGLRVAALFGCVLSMLAETRARADEPPTPPATVLVRFEPSRWWPDLPGELWTLTDRKGQLLCVLPCSYPVGADSGLFLHGTGLVPDGTGTGFKPRGQVQWRVSALPRSPPDGPVIVTLRPASKNRSAAIALDGTGGALAGIGGGLVGLGAAMCAGSGSPCRSGVNGPDPLAGPVAEAFTVVGVTLLVVGIPLLTFGVSMTAESSGPKLELSSGIATLSVDARGLTGRF